jgi:hypothetical protein
MRFAHDCGCAFAQARRSNRARPGLVRTAAAAVVVGTILAACNSPSTEPTAPADAAQSSAVVAAQAAAVVYPIVTIQPVVKTLAVGGKATVSAKLSNASTSWSAHLTTWKSSDPTVISVTTTGWGGADQGNLVGVKDGKATITGTTESGTVGSMVVTVGTGGATTTTPAPIAPISAGTLHEPAGMSTQINAGAMTSLSSPSFAVTMASGLSLTPGGGWRVTYTPSLEGGNAPVVFSTADFASAGSGWLYQRFQIRFSTNFTASSNSGVKINEPRTNYPGGGDNATENHVMYVSAWDVSPSRLSLCLALQGPNGHFADVNPQPSSNTKAVLSTGDGAWHTVEILFGPESSAGAGNGLYQAWVDGTEVANYNNIQWLAAGQKAGWPRVTFVPTYGGGPAHPPSTMYFDVNQLFVSTK